MRYTKILSICMILGFLAFSTGCTQQSTKIAQGGSFRSQAVNDGVHRDMFKALSRSNYEIAVLNIQLSAEKAKKDKDPTTQAAIDKMASDSIAGVKEFAKQRDFMVEWDRDHERANSLKYVTVDAKLFSEIGILNYIGSLFSDESKKVLNAWDAAKEEFIVTTSPAN